MKIVKEQKGITLLALIITIVVLLILAVVTMGAVTESGIIMHAQNAAKDFNQKQQEEESLLAQYEAVIDSQQGIGPWKVTDGETILNRKTGKTKKIGEELLNDEVLEATGGTKSDYEGTWTILGVENGKLKLVSTTDVATDITLGKEDPNLYEKDEEGNPTETLKEGIVDIFNKSGEEANLDLEKAIWSYNHSVETLREIAQNATGISTARSITLEDLEAKEVLNITDEKKIANAGNYGKKYRYYYEEIDGVGKVYFNYLDYNEEDIAENWSGRTGGTNVFINYDKTIIDGKEGNKDNTVTLTYTQYPYTFSDEEKIKYASSLATGLYWLASPRVECGNINSYFHMKHVNNGSINYTRLFDSVGGTRGNSRGVRAIVYI